MTVREWLGPTFVVRVAELLILASASVGVIWWRTSRVEDEVAQVRTSVKAQIDEFKRDVREQLGEVRGDVKELRDAADEGGEGVIRAEAALEALGHRVGLLEQQGQTQVIINQTTQADIARLEARP